MPKLVGHPHERDVAVAKEARTARSIELLRYLRKAEGLPEASR
jgi:hypothetical protein